VYYISTITYYTCSYTSNITSLSSLLLQLPSADIHPELDTDNLGKLDNNANASSLRKLSKSSVWDVGNQLMDVGAREECFVQRVL
jgi:hypothetical protein